jgi:hypothetical protein
VEGLVGLLRLRHLHVGHAHEVAAVGSLPHIGAVRGGGRGFDALPLPHAPFWLTTTRAVLPAGTPAPWWAASRTAVPWPC